MIILTLPRVAPGEAQIRARGRVKGRKVNAVVGHCRRAGGEWRARLWSGFGGCAPGDDMAYAGSRKAMLAMLAEQIGREGPWWK